LLAHNGGGGGQRYTSGAYHLPGFDGADVTRHLPRELFLLRHGGTEPSDDGLNVRDGNIAGRLTGAGTPHGSHY